MALIIPAGGYKRGFLRFSVNGVLQSNLRAGQTISLVSGDPGSFTINLDSPPVGDPNGTETVASFVVQAAGTPAQPDTPLPVKMTVETTEGVLASLSDTVTVSMTETEAVGNIFVPPIPVLPPGSANPEPKTQA